MQAITSERAKLGAMELPRTLDPDVRSELQAAIAESFVAGSRWAMCIAAALALSSALIAGAMITAKQSSTVGSR